MPALKELLAAARGVSCAGVEGAPRDPGSQKTGQPTLPEWPRHNSSLPGRKAGRSVLGTVTRIQVIKDAGAFEQL